MMRPNITLELAADSISVHENGSPIMNMQYPLKFPAGVTLSPAPITLVYDKLGRTTATNITLTGSGNSSGVTANVRVEASGYAFAN
jgi:MSHA pilin protein MshC